MALTVQDDTGLVDGANGYVSVTEFRSYQDARARSYLDDDDSIAAAIIRASDYVDQRFVYKGRRLNARLQAMEWPRMSCYDRDRNVVEGVPQEVKDACCEYALRALLGDLNPDPTQDDTGQRVLKTKQVIGPIDIETEYQPGGGVVMPRYPAADMMLKRAGLVLSGGTLLRA